MRLLSRFKKTDSFLPFIEQNLQLSLSHSLAICLKALKNKKSLSTAYVGTSFLSLSEGLTELGFTLTDPFYAFFDTHPDDIFHPYNPLEKLYERPFDVILTTQKVDKNKLQGSPFVIDIHLFSQAFQQALKAIEKKHFLTCLNPHKLAILAAMCFLLPSQGSVIEAGSYQCGSTIFMAKLLQALHKNYALYALDTFQGMPPATLKDRLDAIFYDAGLFTNNPIHSVATRIRKEGLGETIHLIQGNITDTLPSLNVEKRCELLFLDTDQYAGTKSGLQAVAKEQIPYVIIDDTGLKSIQAAIAEFLEENPNYSHQNLITNFDLVYKNS